MTSGKTGRIEFLRAKHTEHLRMTNNLYREDELSQASYLVEERGIASFFYAVDHECAGETVYAYYGVFYDIDSTLDIDMTSMRTHTLLSVAYDAWEGEKLATAIGALIYEDIGYQMRRGDISN